MEKCDNCKKETDILWYHRTKISKYSVKTDKNLDDVTPEEIIKIISENRINEIPMMICSDCKKFYGMA